jgi:hypothetical protein
MRQQLFGIETTDKTLIWLLQNWINNDDISSEFEAVLEEIDEEIKLRLVESSSW